MRRNWIYESILREYPRNQVSEQNHKLLKQHYDTASYVRKVSPVEAKPIDDTDINHLRVEVPAMPEVISPELEKCVIYRKPLRRNKKYLA